MMFGVADAVNERVAHPDVRRGHVNFRAERALAVGELAVLHPREQVEVFLDAAVAERAFLGVAAVFVGFVRRQVADVGLAFFDERDGVFVNLVEVVGGVERLQRSAAVPAAFLGCLQAGCLRYICRRDACATRNWRKIKIRLAVAGDRFGRFAFGFEAEIFVGPAGDEPVHVFDDGVHVLDVFLGRVGVVHAQIADAAELAGDAEVQADAFGVADVQVAVRLGRKAGVDVRIFFLGDVFLDDVADEIGRGGGRRIFGVRIAHLSGAG